jgi:hypothetical protein
MSSRVVRARFGCRIPAAVGGDNDCHFVFNFLRFSYRMHIVVIIEPAPAITSSGQAAEPVTPVNLSREANADPDR